MVASVAELESRRGELLRQIGLLGEFRRGSVFANHRKCGKAGCKCATEGAWAHPAQYLWTATVNGKTVGRGLHLGPEVEKYMKETERYKEFVKLCQELVEVSEKLCDARPVEEVKRSEELEDLKKKLQRRLLKRQRKK